MIHKFYCVITLIIILLPFTAKGQVSTLGNAGAPADYVGWNNLQAFPLQIRHNAAQPIDFYTNMLQRMTITAAGDVGVGIAAPAQKFVVSGGNMDVNTSTNGYMINNAMTMWRGTTGNLSNIFVGASAGTANTTGSSNTFVGFQSGTFNLSGNFNTYIGRQAGNQGNSALAAENVMVGALAGYSNQGEGHIFIGSRAGYTQNAPGVVGNVYIGQYSGFSGTNAGENCFVGWRTGEFNTTSANTFIGFNSGANNTTGGLNTFLGVASGISNISGARNTYLGALAGNGNTIGNDNTYIGRNAGPSVNNLNNTATFGAATMVTASNKMILGNDSMNVGIGLNADMTLFGPQNKLEIDAGINGHSPSPIGTVGLSGLRFRDLHAGNLPIANPSGNVLSVSAAGDVILVSPPPGTVNANNGCSVFGTNTVQLGNIMGGIPVAQLINNREVPMNNYNILWSGIGTQSVNLFNIGTNNPYTGSSLASKLYVYNDIENTAAHFETGGTNITLINPIAGITGAEGSVFDIYSTATGLLGFANGSTSPGTATPAFIHGTYGFALNGQNHLFPIGARGFASTQYQSSNAYGGYFTAQGAVGITPLCYGIYAEVTGSFDPLSYSGFFTGADVWGNTGVCITSDSSVKTNVNSISNALETLSDIDVYTYYYDPTVLPQAGFDDQIHFGVIAQELETTLPSLVKEGYYPAVLDSIGDTVYVPKTIKGVKYHELIPILIQGVKDLKDSTEMQKNTIDALQVQVSQMQDDIQHLYQMISNCCESSQSRVAQPQPDHSFPEINVELSNTYMVILEQNVPNPFAENTTINFYIPEQIKTAQMFFSDANGKMLKTIEITDRGEGRINVYGQDLSSGTYIYTLVLEGKVYESKRMIKN